MVGEDVCEEVSEVRADALDELLSGPEGLSPQRAVKGGGGRGRWTCCMKSRWDVDEEEM